MLSFVGTVPGQNPQDITFWEFFGGPVVGAAIMAGGFTVVNKIIDRRKPKADQVQEQMKALVSGLESMINILSNDKAQDAERISRLTNRIEELENASITDIETRNTMYSELRDLGQQIIRKEMSIQILVEELKKFGVTVLGIESGFSHKIEFIRGDYNE